MSDNPRCPKCDYHLSWCVCHPAASPEAADPRLTELLDDLEGFLESVEWSDNTSEKSAGDLVERIREFQRAALGEARTPEDWKTAALLKDRTRREMRSRARAGDTPEAIAADWGVPLEFVTHLLSWQLFGDQKRG